MCMVKRFVSLSVYALAVLGCEQQVNAPGACPEFCPSAEIVIIDTVLTDVIALDTSFFGYLVAHEAAGMQVIAGPAESRGVLRFGAFSDLVPLDSTQTAPVAELDSFQIALSMAARTPGTTGLSVTLHRLPVSVDSLISYASIAPFFDDSTVIGAISVPDTATADTISTIVPASAFPTFVDDGRVAAIGLSIRDASGNFVTLGTVEAGLAAILTRFVRADSADGVLVDRSDLRAVVFDTFVHQPSPAASPFVLVVGGEPSARAFLRVTIPDFIIDASEVVAAELLLVPVEPVLGAVGDTLQIVANGLGADFGAKSPLVVTLVDSASLARVVIGSMDTVRVPIEIIVGQWQNNSNQPRTIVLRTGAEAASVAELRIGSSQWMGAQPALRLVYVPPFQFVQR